MPFALVNNHKIHYTDNTSSSSSSTSTTSAVASATTKSHSKTLIFIHGLGSTQSYFSPILPYLTPQYRCITFDNYGAGRSPFQIPEHSVGLDTSHNNDGNKSKKASIKSVANDAVALLTHLGVEGDVVVVGYSMGGIAVSEICSRRVEKAAVAGAVATTEPKFTIAAGVAIGPVHPTETVAKVFEGRIKTVSEAEVGMEPMANTIPYAAPGSRTSALARAFIREMLLGQSADGYVANCRAIAEAADSPPVYGDVKCPMLLLAGSEDKSASVEGCRFIFDQWGTSESQKHIEVLDGVGHWYCVEEPEKVGQLVKDFVERLK